jgi:hypothetical protein
LGTPACLAGHRYCTGPDLVEAEAVDIVTTAAISARQARAAGYATIEDLLAGLHGSPALPLYRGGNYGCLVASAM